MAKVVLFGPGWEELVEAARFDAKELARLCRLSSRQLQREFRRHFGRSPQSWLTERKMQAAQKLLLAGEPVKNVALDLGFRHVSYFCMRFKSIKKMTPGEFVALHERSANGCRKSITDVGKL